MLRILYVIRSLERAGAPKQLALLCEQLREDVDAHVCALRAGGAFQAELEALGVPVTVLNQRAAWDPIAFWRLRRLVARLRPDIVHTWGGDAGIAGRLAAMTSVGVQVVASERTIAQNRGGVRWGIDQALAIHSRSVVAVSNAVRDHLVEHGLSPQQVRVIPGGVSAATRSTLSRAELLAELSLPSEVRLIGYVGPLRREKRVKDLVWAADLVHLINENSRLLIIGEGPDRTVIEQFIRESETSGWTKCLGERGDVADILPHLDVFWIGSERAGMPNAVLEAMAAGVPVVASDIPAHRELITHGESGFLVPVGARRERAHATDRLYHDPALAKRIGEAGRTSALEKFPAERMADAYRELYESLQ